MARPTVLERVVARTAAHPVAVDAGLAALVLLLTVWLPRPGLSLAEVLVGVALVVPLAWRRRAPLPAAVVVLVAGLVELVVSDQFLPANLAAPAMVYALAAYGPRWAGRAGLAAGLAGAALASLRYAAPDGLSEQPDAVLLAGCAIALTVVASWALGLLRKVRLQQVSDLRERARLLLDGRDRELRLAAVAERARIAREMHDVVAHSLSVVVAQADGGRYAATSDPAAAAGALDAIAATGRQALADMRALLGVLREDRPDDFAPQPDLRALGSLVAGVRVSGLDVDLRVLGAPGPIGAGAELAVYRIVQESLTNVLKHAGPAVRAQVRLQWRPDVLEVSVVDDGRGASARREATGRGLVGMQERAEMHGGHVHAGPRSGGGFGVRATLPRPSGEALPYRPGA